MIVKYAVDCYNIFMPRPKPLVLVILDAFGVSTERDGNPVFEARKPTFDRIDQWFPFTTLQASGVAVGLPWGEAGNSEVGHLTMGAGRVINHHLPRIISSVHDGSFFENERFRKAADHVISRSGRLHIAGLVSSGSVHSYIDHLYALLDFTRDKHIPRVYLHLFTDGKDAPPKEGAVFFAELEKRLASKWPHVRLGTVVGRFYAMDRDGNWERTQRAYELLTQGKGVVIGVPSRYLAESYTRGITDEFVEPAVIGEDGEGTIRSGDALMFMNFREDSMRQLADAFVREQFDHFSHIPIEDLFLVTMTDYEKEWSHLAAFPSPGIRFPLAEVLGEEGLRHIHIAETNKYAHVTYFFNGGRETPFKNEERVLIPSVTAPHPDDIPQMRASEVTAAILEHMHAYDVIIANFANADLVGHSGNFSAASRTVEILDESVGALVNSIMNSDGVIIITGDHGGIELKRNVISGEKHTEHSINPVPFYLIGKQFKRGVLRTDADILTLKKEVGGILTDIAPTILDLLHVRKPHEMTGTSLLPFLMRQMEA